MYNKCAIHLFHTLSQLLGYMSLPLGPRQSFNIELIVKIRMNIFPIRQTCIGKTKSAGFFYKSIHFASGIFIIKRRYCAIIMLGSNIIIEIMH